MDGFAILKYQGINPGAVRKFDFIEEGNNIVLFAQLKEPLRPCPYCKSEDTVIKEYKPRIIHGLNTGNKNVEINLRIPRYSCKKCKKTFTYDTSAFIANSITKDELDKILVSFGLMTTFTDIAKIYNLTVTEVVKLFDKYCENLNEEIGEAICIDEFKNSGNNDMAKYACILVNFETHKIIDILPSRTLPF